MNLNNATREEALSKSIDIGNGIRQVTETFFINGKMVRPPLKIQLIDNDAGSTKTSPTSDGVVSQESASYLLDKEI